MGQKYASCERVKMQEIKEETEFEAAESNFAIHTSIDIEEMKIKHESMEYPEMPPISQMQKIKKEPECEEGNFAIHGSIDEMKTELVSTEYETNNKGMNTSDFHPLNQWQSTICSTEGSNIENAIQHVTSFQEKPFKCCFCDYNCSNIGNMSQHVLSAHEGKKPFKSSFCEGKE